MTPVLMPASLPSGVDVDAILAAAGTSHVYAPAADAPGLQQMVQKAAGEGINLRIVVLERDPAAEEQLRDLATTVGKQEGGTVLVMSPHLSGTYSDSIDRFQLESAQHLTHTGSPVTSAEIFVDKLGKPPLPWTGFTVALLVVVALAIAVGTWLNVRRHRLAAPVDDAGVAAKTTDRTETEPAGPEQAGPDVAEMEPATLPSDGEPIAR
ncbi:Rv1476 family membrane protein [Speluncibacter jeojiensis]|uniref:Uncharacterized protein n=1 Tax=Speluncibacter jeojiensis TaxID=2710754 RepID=A0A9X4REN3_9ACTN|nr:DUF6676 family protein [Rhodococcus sp. D2-41]MDG3015949.1 hypothetical protein [Corynebacteriales bacterium D3-21]